MAAIHRGPPDTGSASVTDGAVVHGYQSTLSNAHYAKWTESNEKNGIMSSQTRKKGVGPRERDDKLQICPLMSTLLKAVARKLSKREPALPARNAMWS